jgi:hypothetical protein
LEHEARVQHVVAKTPVKSLDWQKDDLVDFLNGEIRWSSDGTETAPSVRRVFSFPFDQTIVSPTGRYLVVYAERGTKALLLENGKLLRELNRSYYHAPDFDYPVALGSLPGGRDIVVHCPDQYNVLHIDDAKTGLRLTSGPRSPIDVFHSHLSISPDGRHLLVAGWVWHPYGTCMVFDLQQALADPTALDGRGLVAPYDAVDAEVESACWLDSDRVVMAASPEEPLDGDVTDILAPGQIGVWSISTASWLHRTTIDYRIGTMIAAGDRVVALHDHPRLVDPATGVVLAEWVDIAAGAKSGSFGVTHIPTPITALHPDGRRLAIAQPHGIAIIHLPTH